MLHFSTKKKLVFIAAFFFIISSIAIAQETFPVNGAFNKIHTKYAFTHANIFVDYKTKIENATLIIQDNLIIEVGTNISIPNDAIIIDLNGKYIYPSFIDAFTNYGIPDSKKDKTSNNPDASNKGAYAWNQALKPEVDAAKMFQYNNTQAEELRKLGFGTVHTFAKDGIARGQGLVVSLSDEAENLLVLKSNVSANYSFDKGTSTQDYPNSLMGCIALMRQTYLDASWYKTIGYTEQKNISLEAWNNIQNIPQIFESNGKYNILRADKIGKEFNVQYVFKTSGDEYQRINEIKQLKASLIVPVNFPVTPDVEDPANAEMLDLQELKHWELAPFNLSILSNNAVNFAITTSDLKNKTDFFTNLKKAVDAGLTDTAALKALTKTPASILKIDGLVGSLQKGKIANFIITSNKLFQDKNIIYENWIQGKRFILKDSESLNISGKITIDGVFKSPFVVTVSEAETKYKSDILIDSTKISGNLTILRNNFQLIFSHKNIMYQLIGALTIDANKNITSLSGYWTDSLGVRNNWKAKYTLDTSNTKAASKDSSNKKIVQPQITFPLMANGWSEAPKQEKYLVKNATIWTNESVGVLKETDVLIENGKITAIGKNLSANNAIIIDGQGKHLTPGIIDEHSHIAISNGVNEGTQSSTAEVRIGDVINPDDINIYRQLSGGVVAAQLLHGSANAIGGQSALIKLRWGAAPEKMKIEGADGFIKFALGENVKQSNWGDRNTTRYPQTRMGVEQVYYDAFTRAREYDLKYKAGNKNFRRDLDLEALAEILNRKRFITCHSYQQGEINMLMHVADSFHFKINTFTHILEGYKVADKMKVHGVGASTFADWWAYKFEVMEAIPYNASIMNKMGLVVAINSDDAEMGRRLNQEAAKSIKYGGLTEEEALKLCTLNPAILLHLDNKMGSIKVGKDADIVLWNNNPLSIYAKAEKTFVDGILYYDATRDEQNRVLIAKERERILRKMLAAKKGGDTTEKPKQKVQILYHCDD